MVMLLQQLALFVFASHVDVVSGNVAVVISDVDQAESNPYRTTLNFPAGAFPRLEASPRGSMWRRDDR